MGGMTGSVFVDQLRSATGVCIGSGPDEATTGVGMKLACDRGIATGEFEAKAVDANVELGLIADEVPD